MEIRKLSSKQRKNSLFCGCNKIIGENKYFFCLSDECDNQKVMCLICQNKYHRNHKYTQIISEQKSKIDLSDINKTINLIKTKIQEEFVKCQRIQSLFENFIINLEAIRATNNFGLNLEDVYNKVNSIQQQIIHRKLREACNKWQQINENKKKDEILMQLKQFQQFLIRQLTQIQVKYNKITSILCSKQPHLMMKLFQLDKMQQKSICKIEIEGNWIRQKSFQQAIITEKSHLQIHNVWISNRKLLGQIPEPLKILKKLQRLTLGNSRIKVIQNLQQFSKLISLNLVQNQIQKIENIQKLQNLQQLKLDNNCISKIEGLDKNIKLREIGLSGNKISKVQNIEHLQQLTSITLYNNYINLSEQKKNIDRILKIFANQPRKLLKIYLDGPYREYFPKKPLY